MVCLWPKCLIITELREEWIKNKLTLLIYERRCSKKILYHRSNGGIELDGNERDPDAGVVIKDVKKVKIIGNAFADDSDAD